MEIPPHITFRGLPRSEAVESRAIEKVAWLERFYPDIIACHVIVEAEHHHHVKGNLYHIRIELSVPDSRLIINQPHHDRHSHEDIYVAIRDAFDAAWRRLQDFTRRRRDRGRHLNTA